MGAAARGLLAAGIDRRADVRATSVEDRGIEGMSARVATPRGSPFLLRPRPFEVSLCGLDILLGCGSVLGQFLHSVQRPFRQHKISGCLPGFRLRLTVIGGGYPDEGFALSHGLADLGQDLAHPPGKRRENAHCHPIIPYQPAIEARGSTFASFHRLDHEGGHLRAILGKDHLLALNFWRRGSFGLAVVGMTSGQTKWD
jgi:hypothetical protein